MALRRCRWHDPFKDPIIVTLLFEMLFFIRLDDFASFVVSSNVLKAIPKIDILVCQLMAFEQVSVTESRGTNLHTCFVVPRPLDLFVNGSHQG